ncbi:glycosyltransferase family 2 protein [Thermoflavifilum thermophilum]|uniref:Glycosyltransferase involved in cell wall bisynthesis n=1 Tax=Thermoflavifilum thermophilum TaxID=1393122 RepID=A0A1I7NBJ8_9BACT|nr:glycosyltransferase [Thermoflavifilum thermophilum]SFV32040.1 Glycosyltransferase involved in cell wall bisynthesis [Thermoflavifilum thermophilum]
MPVTVLMPVYNGETYVEAAIRSVLGQSYRDFELLIINDGSTDQTLPICEMYATQDKRIRIVDCAERGGITRRLNEGISLAKFEWIARMDADDICHPWRLAKQIAYLEAHPRCAMVTSRVHLMDEQGRYLGTEGIPAAYLYYTLHFECCIFHPAIMFHRQSIEAIGGYQLPFAEDYDLFARILKRYLIGGIDEPLLSYRIHGKSLHRYLHREEYAESLKEVRKKLWLSVYPELPPEAYQQAFQYDYQSLTGVQDMLQCLHWLDVFSQSLLHLDNPNRVVPDILYIWKYKRNWMIQQMAARLSFRQRARFLRSALSGPAFWKQMVWQSIKHHGI